MLSLAVVLATIAMSREQSGFSSSRIPVQGYLMKVKFELRETTIMANVLCINIGKLKEREDLDMWRIRVERKVQLT